MLSGVNVALGVTGSIAAVKVVEIAHELRRRGANVRAVMSEGSRGIVHPWSVEFATENDVITELTGRVEHVDLCGRDGWADVLLIAPATANTVGKIASAIDDTPVTTCATTALGAGVPVVIAPAMHEPMYDHPGVLDAIERVEEWGVSFVSPRIEEGKAKIASEDAIALTTARIATPSPLSGERVVVTAGATAESVDPVRVLTNRSSGKTGREVARACYVAGANVTLIHALIGPHPLDEGSDEDPAAYAEVVRVEEGVSLSEAALAAATGADAYVSVAAISDYTVETEDQKIRSGQDLSLDLLPSPKVVDAVREEYPELPIIGFKTETSGDDEAMVEAARAIKDRVDMSFVVANDAGVMGAAETRTLFVDGGVTEHRGTKAEIGAAVARRLARTLGEASDRGEG
ncbi:bifunctional phosphopantothenoylcysteine decarboxylase/phosphopantothenate--cysteine ligase CoaBC [Halalkalicoccus subterraneus]|uniref:bifunctional phosphopantothenoylcysteine decarboxylase/phosphopantothenate--cysteine ligase CoaBC n=1 Tax=Halalkalicoccus subterraneus TaxID=2675002 RepID=UPI000EFC2460|nr:bifunctional phosphopantothenoylcysteine decarboxylase/phosphopantothenate--cysteine ligase CoaBC [Halalkalicoccus subterraneus]